MSQKAIDYLDLIYEEPYKIGHWVGFADLTELHNDWIRDFLFAEQDQTLLAHRGSYKTTSLSVCLALMIVLRPDLNIIFLRKTDTDVIEIVRQVAKMLEHDVMQDIAKELYGRNIVQTISSSSEINTNLNTFSRGSSQLIGMGILTSITGKHGDVIVTDDIVNVRDRASKSERERTKQAYMELQNIKNRGGRFINTGTPWHKEDAISFMPNVKRYDCYSTGLMSKEEIRRLRESMTASLFAANYELKHIADEKAMFTSPKFFEDNSLLYDGIAHIDASYGGDDGTAFTIAKRHGNNFYVFGKRWDAHVDDCLSKIYIYHQHFRAGTIYNEFNADKGYLANNMRRDGKIVQTYHEKENKFIKISTYLRKHWVNIYFHEDTDPEYTQEILDYTENAEHDDAPDSLSSLIRIMDKSRDEGDYKDTLSAFKGFGL